MFHTVCIALHLGRACVIPPPLPCFLCSVIKVILQFCKENSLVESLNAIQVCTPAMPARLSCIYTMQPCVNVQNECQVTLNTVDSIENFVSDINNGRWDQVLPQVANLKLPRKKLEDLYEQVVVELIELRETDTARAMLRQTQVFSHMQQDDPERYVRLERLCNRAYFDVSELYGAVPREKRRALLAQALSAEVATVPPSRLMTLVGQALKW